MLLQHALQGRRTGAIKHDASAEDDCCDAAAGADLVKFAGESCAWHLMSLQCSLLCAEVDVSGAAFFQRTLEEYSRIIFSSCCGAAGLLDLLEDGAADLLLNRPSDDEMAGASDGKPNTLLFDIKMDEAENDEEHL